MGVLHWEPPLRDSHPCSFWEHWLPMGHLVPSLGLHFSAGKSSSLPRDSVRMTTSWVLKTTEIDCLTVLEARNLRSRHQRAVLPLQFWRRTCTVHLSRLLAASGNPCHSLVCRHITLISTSIFTWSPPYVSASKFPSSHKDPGPWIRDCPNPVWPPLTWITPTKTPVSK